MSERELSRRSALQGSAAVVVGAAVGYGVTRNSAAAKSTRGTTAANAYGPDTGASGKKLVAVADIPAGGGKIVGDVVVTKDSAGQVHAFSAVCTHQGCTVDRVANGTINCPCHASRFDATTGKVVGGPAPRPLPTIAVTIQDGQVYTS
jgi:Rieske Fe-S protein